MNGLFKRHTINDHCIRLKDFLFDQIGEAFFEFWHTEAFNAKGHDEPMGQNHIPQLVTLLDVVVGCYTAENFLIPQTDFFDGIIEADMQNIFFPEHAV